MKRAVSLFAAVVLCGIVSATEMFVKQRNGVVVRYATGNVEEVYFGEPNPSDLTFRILPDSTAEITGRSRELAEYIIPDSVDIEGRKYAITSIADSAFMYCSALEHIELPGTLKNIGKDGFSYCSSLERIFIPNNVVTMGKYVFSGCIRLHAVVDNSPKYMRLAEKVFIDVQSVKYLRY